MPALIVTSQLTDAGRRFALAGAETCLVARLALGLEDEWPAHYVRAAIESCNALGEQTADAG